MDLITVIRDVVCRRPKSQQKEELGNLVKGIFNDLLFRRKTHTPNISQRLKLKKKRHRENILWYIVLVKR